MASQLTVLIYKEGYPPEWDEEVFKKVLEQVENYKTNRITFAAKLNNVEDDSEVRNLIFNRLQLDDNTTDLQLQREVIEIFGDRYPGMTMNDWRHIIEDYTPMVRNANKAREIPMNVSKMAAEEGIEHKIELTDDEGWM